MDLIGLTVFTNAALKYGVKLSIEIDGNAKKPKACIKLFKNFGPGQGSRSKKIEMDIESLPLFTIADLLGHIAQFIHPVIGF